MNATITALNEAIAHIDEWHQQAAGITVELMPDHHDAALYASGREDAFEAVVDYLRELDTSTAEPGVSA